MTTIISNGYYMVADKRTTLPAPRQKKTTSLESRCENFKHSRPPVTGYLDETTKLIPEPKTTYNDKKILCLAAAGSVSVINYQLALLAHMTMDQLLKLNSSTDGGEGGCSFIFITEDFHTHKVHYAAGHDDPISMSSFPPGTNVVLGSGNSIINVIDRRLPGVFNKVHILSLFLFTTNTDKGSSNCFDVYGCREAKYFCKIIPTHEEVRSRCDEVTKLLKFGETRKTHLFNNERKS